MKRIQTPFNKRDCIRLNVGEEVLLSGVVYTARDQAHKRLVDMLAQGRDIPFALRDQIIYYCGPTATPVGKVIGACGPTTSARMDSFAEPLLKAGLSAMIGKGRRSRDVQDLLRRYRAVYFIAPSGCGALLAQRVVSKEQVCFNDLGPEAVYRILVSDFPLIVAIDASGKSLYDRLEKY